MASGRATPSASTTVASHASVSHTPSGHVPLMYGITDPGTTPRGVALAR